MIEDQKNHKGASSSSSQSLFLSGNRVEWLAIICNISEQKIARVSRQCHSTLILLAQ